MRSAIVRLGSGPRLHYIEHGPAAGEPIVFLHGWPDSSFSFSRVMPLMPAPHRLFAMDQRGFGDSERPASDYRIDDLAADAVAFLDAVGVECATLVGHSLGSFVARCVAIARPERVARLVLVGTTTRVDGPLASEVQTSLATLGDPVPLEFAREFQSSTVHAPVPEAFFEQMLAESVKAPARVWREVFAGALAYDDAAQLARIGAPTLLVWGAHDAYFPRAAQETLRSSIPDARLVIYPHIGHCPNWEWPEQLATDLAAFVEATTEAVAGG